MGMLFNYAHVLPIADYSTLGMCDNVDYVITLFAAFNATTCGCFLLNEAMIRHLTYLAAILSILEAIECLMAE